jgi:hypothetical protein
MVGSWRPVMGAFKTAVSEARMTPGRGLDESDVSKGRERNR